MKTIIQNSMYGIGSQKGLNKKDPGAADILAIVGDRHLYLLPRSTSIIPDFCKDIKLFGAI